MKRKISVAICTFNGEDYIRAQLESIIHQSLKPDEIVICDDISTDETINIATEILTSSGLYFIVNKNDIQLGVRKNFEKCFSLCTGDIIFSCDQDDIWLEKKIETYVEAFDKNDDVIMVYSDAMVIDESGQTLHESWWGVRGIETSNLSMDKYCDIILCNWIISGFNLAIRARFFDQIRPFPDFSYHDGWIAICAPCHGTVIMIPEILAQYRRHKKNVTLPQKNLSHDKSHAYETSGHNRSQKLAKLNKNLFDGISSRYYFNLKFLETHQEALAWPENENYRKKCEESTRFFGDLMSCNPMHLLHSYRILLLHTLNGNYWRWRGGTKKLIKDLLSLLVRRMQC